MAEVWVVTVHSHDPDSGGWVDSVWDTEEAADAQSDAVEEHHKVQPGWRACDAWPERFEVRA